MEQFTSCEQFISWVQIQKRFSKKVNLDKMRYFCQIFGNPQDKFKSIHITGSNGKGSTVAMLASILMQHGYHVATFTSPYVKSFQERISFDQLPIDDSILLHIANQIHNQYPTFEKDGYEMPSFFEFITLIAFIYFASLEDLDIALIEVGMGGRLDSTNVIYPILSIITNVSLEHMAVLGDTKEAILTEKLGIVKPNIPVVCGLKEDNLKQIARQVASKYNAHLSLVNYDQLVIKQSDLKGSTFDYQEFKSIHLSLLGFHQIENALVVLEACKILSNRIKLDNDKMLEALSKTSWIGRLETIVKSPRILIDGSHNVDGVSRVCEFIRSLSIKPTRAIVSISHDKELKAMIDELDKTFDEIIFTKYTYKRSADAADLYTLSRAKHKKMIENLDDAILYVQKNSCPLTIFMGSLYLVSEVRNKFISKKE